MNELLYANDNLGAINGYQSVSKNELIKAALDIFKELPKGFQMFFLSSALLSTVGLVKYAIEQGYGYRKDANGCQVSKGMA